MKWAQFPLVGAAILISCSAATATDFGWTNTAGGTFSTAGNWTPSGPPSTGDKATFGLAASFTVDFIANAASDYLVVTGTNQVTFDLAGNTYNVTTGPGVPTATTIIGNGASDNVKLIVTDGTLNLRNESSLKYANLALSGSTATLEVNSSGGGAGHLNYNYIDSFGTGGTITVTGSGSTLTGGSGYLQMPGGTLNVSNGATATIANFAGSGAVNVDNATLTQFAGVFRVVQSGGTINVTNGGTIDTSVNTFEMGVSGGAGVVTVGNGVGNSTVTGGQILFGTAFDPNRGSPEMKINSGGVVQATGTTNSFYVYDRGTATLNGGAIEIVQGGSVRVADIDNNNISTPEGLLRGSGTIRRITGGATNFSVINDGQIKPGDTSATPAIGTISIANGDLTQNAGGTTAFDFSVGNLSDKILMTSGAATINGTITYSILGSTPDWALSQGWVFLQADTINYSPSSDNMLSLLAGFGVTPYFYGVRNDGSQDVLELIIPEPSALALLGMGGAALAGIRRRYRQIGEAL